jgi:hypothetical protein
MGSDRAFRLQLWCSLLGPVSLLVGRCTGSGSCLKPWPNRKEAAISTSCCIRLSGVNRILQNLGASFVVPTSSIAKTVTPVEDRSQ